MLFPDVSPSYLEYYSGAWKVQRWLDNRHATLGSKLKKNLNRVENHGCYESSEEGLVILLNDHK